VNDVSLILKFYTIKFVNEDEYINGQIQYSERTTKEKYGEEFVPMKLDQGNPVF